MNKAKIAVVQDSPALFDLKESLKKVRKLAMKASAEKVDLILFPEAFLPGYPRGFTFGTSVGSRSEEGRELWLKYHNNAVTVPGDEFQELSKIAREAKAYLVIGVIEKGETGTLFCTVLYFDDKGELVGKHRKLKPTGSERIIWGEGTGDDLDTIKTPFGKIGGLICWENYMPLARTHLYQQGIDIYLAPTADQRDSWQATMKHIACEGRCFVVGCNQYVKGDEYAKEFSELMNHPEKADCKGGSAVIDPFGNEVVGPIWDQADILIAELDLSLVTKGKMDFDVVGHYARPDVFELLVKK